MCIDEARKNAESDELKGELNIEFSNLSVKLKKKENKLKDFTNQTGLKRDKFREQVFANETGKGYGKSVSAKAVWENKKELDKYKKYHYNKNGIIIVTDDWKNKNHPSIPKKYKPHAVVETYEKKGDYTQINRAIYNSDAMMIKQIHSGNHNAPKLHPYGINGEHAHDYIWENDKIIKRTTRELEELERKKNGDIL